ncbi:MAG: hypothetical protein RJB58_2296 [Pseudomonadota bacterium]|jgi:hypothetical protein
MSTIRFRPAGFLFLSEAIEAVGKYLYPSEWLGTEPLPGVAVRSCEPWFVTPEAVRLQLRRAAQLGIAGGNLATGWYAQLADGVEHQFSNETEARAAWEKCKAQVDQRHQLVAAMRARFERARDFLRERLGDGRIAAVIWNQRTGNQGSGSKSFWLSHDGERQFEPEHWPHYMAARGGLEGIVLIDDGTLRSATSAGVQPALAVSPAQAGTPPSGAIDAATKRSRNAAHKADFIVWADESKTANGTYPSRRQAHLDFAKPRGLSRDWARHAIAALPAADRKRSGAPIRKTIGRQK